MAKTERKTDRHETFVAEALMLRALHSYREARDRAKDGGVDLSMAPDVKTEYSDLSDRYEMLLQNWVSERPDTAHGVVAVLDLAAMITADVARDAHMEASLIIPEDRDLAYALQLIDGARFWANARDIGDYMDEHVRPEVKARFDELEARCKAIAAEYDAPLSEGDAGLIAAIERARALEAREKALYREFNVTLEIETDIVLPIIEPARDRLLDRIRDTPPVGREGVLAKLRYIVDRRNGLVIEEAEEPLKQVLAVLEQDQ